MTLHSYPQIRLYLINQMYSLFEFFNEELGSFLITILVKVPSLFDVS